MAILKSNAVQDNRPAVTPDGFEEVVVPVSYSLSAALANGDVIGLAKVAPGMVVTDVCLGVPDLDTGATPAITFDVGLVENDATYTAVDTNAYVSGSTAGQAGGLVRMDQVAGLGIAPHATNTRVVALTVTAGPATGATTGTITGWVKMRPKTYDE